MMHKSDRLATRLPAAPAHLTPAASAEWRRVARSLRDMGVLTPIDRGALAAYCQAWGRWVEAEERLQESQLLYKTPSGYVQQSPWLGIIHKQLELMGRYMIELGMTPASRSRVTTLAVASVAEPLRITRVIVDMKNRELERFTRGGATAISDQDLEGIDYAPLTESQAI
jgi:P27 family predicted phage terminase small subunit